VLKSKPIVKTNLFKVNKLMATALIVEDVQSDRMILSTYLEAAGFQVATAISGEDALAHLSDRQPDIIFLDIVLPGRSGFEICRAIKSHADTQKIPVVMCSTKTSDMDRFWGLKQGADQYLSKPLNREELLDTLQKLAIN
jgi:two-component system, chemotaxis family, response regulator PixH